MVAVAELFWVCSVQLCGKRFIWVDLEREGFGE
jgi:hypothetical protein